MNQGLLDEASEGRLFWWVRQRELLRALHSHLTTGILRTATVVVLTVIFWVGMYWLFYEGFRFLATTIADEATRASLVQSVYNAFFFSLMLMLGASSAILFYTAVYTGPNTPFLLSSPVRPSRIVIHKFQESTVVAGWAFIVLGTPLLLAYGIVAHAPWYYFLLMPVYLVSFIMVAAGMGTLACLFLIAKLYRFRQIILALIIALFIGGTIALIWTAVASASHDISSPRWFYRIQRRLQVTQVPWLPSWWLSAGLLEAAHPASRDDFRSSWQETIGYLAVLSTSAAVLPMLIGIAGNRWLRQSYGQLRGKRKRQWSSLPGKLDRFLEILLYPFPLELRLLLIKDIRLFRRDPVHWSQLLILIGLLGLYFLIVPRLRYGSTGIVWLNCIGFFNLTVVGLLSSTLTTRFIYPLISLEGQRFWILGTLPIRRESILWSKLIFSVLMLALPCGILTLLSDFTLRIPQETPWMAVSHQLICFAMCTGLAALAVGLGARLPDLRETSPAKISANFGGTLNLVLSAVYVLTTVATVGLPACLWLQAHYAPEFGFSHWNFAHPGWLIFGGIFATLLNILVVYFPLRAGFSHFRHMET